MKNTAKKEVSRQLKRLLALTTMGCVLFVSIFTVGAFSKKVDIYDGENVVSVLTINTDTNKIMEQANIRLSSDDLIFRIDNPDNTTEIVVKRAFDVFVLADDQKTPMKFVTGTVEDAIISSGVLVGENDVVTPDLHTNLEPDMQISVQRRNKLTINADNRKKDYTVPIGMNISEALKFLDIPIYENDIISEDLSAVVTDGMAVSIQRVGYRNKITTKVIPYKTIKKEVDYLDEGVTQTSVKGVNGESEIVVKETMQDGEVVKSEEIKNKVTLQPVNEVILVGTKKKNQTIQVSSANVSKDKTGTILDNKGKALSYSRVLTGSGTAYTAEKGAITSTGTVPKYGTVAVNPNIIPYGTKMYIVSTDGYVYGYAVAADTGGALRQGTALVDLYMNSTQECLSFGRRTVKVYILN